MSFEMTPFEDRTPDAQYQNLLRYVLEHGERRPTTNQGVPAISVFRPPIQLRFDLRKNAPLITERKIGFWRQAVGEILAFVNGAITIQELEKFGCRWWGQWATKECCDSVGIEKGTLGPGSYGFAFHNFPTPGLPDGFNQFAALVSGLKEKPYSRTNLISPWVPYYASEYGDRKVFCAPCHGWINCYVSGNRLDMSMDQRSCDIPIGLPANLIQYSALLLALAQVCNLEPGYYIHTFVDAHFYEDQLESVEELINREPRRLPTLRIVDQSINDLFSFRPENFAISDYEPHPAMPNISVSI